MIRPACLIYFILFFGLCNIALAQSTFQSTGPKQIPDTWKQEEGGQLKYYWVDTNGDGSPNIYYAFLGLRYRQVQLDENGDGFFEFLSLLNQDGNYKYYHDLDKDGSWEAVPSPDPSMIDDPFEKYRNLLIKGVTRRIAIDETAGKWQPGTQGMPYGFKCSGSPASKKLIIRLTKTPTVRLDDPQREAKPLHLVEIPIKAVRGEETSWLSGTIFAENDFFNEGRRSIKAQVALNVFWIPFHLQYAKGNVTKSNLVQVSGTLAIGDEKNLSFCTLIDNSPGDSAAVTVPVLDTSGKDGGSIFIEVIPTSTTAD